MSLPPGFLDELRSRTSLAQVAGRKLTWDLRKSNQGKGDMWAPCPFHQEKTASFHVDDRKGYYYCFGCHQKGDAISFVRETENVGFMEAVAILAREAGMPVPQADPRAQEKADRRTELTQVMEQAVQWFRLQLKTAAGAPARAYLDGRGMGSGVQERWDIGFAPDAWQGLWDHLRGKGVAEDLILGAGLAKPSQKGGKPYDVFRGRIMFPIRDARGRTIAFGGRAMDPGDAAKYLNSPETELFDKGRSLYNFARAREAAGKGQPLLVAEGYVDVIALSEAGFTAAVAPLGTAVTDTQLQLMWRIAPEPVIALDGDTAGLRAAMRVIDLALPMLEAGQSLRFALMPQGMDPDDVIRQQGPTAMRALIDAAVPMVRLLWQRETDGRVFDSPERKAALDKALRERIRTIRDPSIRNHYGEEIRALRADLFGQTRPKRRDWKDRRDPARQSALASTRASALAAAPEGAEDHLREAAILAALICTPSVAPEFDAALTALDCRDPAHRALRDAIVQHLDAGEALGEAVARMAGQDTLEKLLSARHVAIIPCVRNPGDLDMTRMTVAEELAKLEARRGLMAEIAEAAEDLVGLPDEAVTWRLGQAALAMGRAVRSENEDKTAYDTAPNGARISRDERSTFDALMQKITYSKPGRPARIEENKKKNG